MKGPQPSDHVAAFTLMELLVVVGIVSLLAALLLPTLSSAKARSRSVACAANLSQLGKAMAMHDGDTGFYPGAGDFVQATPQGIKRITTAWSDRLGPYLQGNNAVFQCPAHEPFRDGPVTAPSYGYNAFGTGWVGTGEQLGLGTSMTNVRFVQAGSVNVRSPADMVAIGEIWLPPGLWVDWLGPNRKSTAGGLHSLVAERHRGRANAVFCDGHVETALRAKWIEASEGARRRWNMDGLPHPETW